MTDWISDEDAPIPTWQKVGVALVALAALCFIVFDWSRFLADFWPLDHSNIGPNLAATVAQWVVLVCVGCLLWPPLRRRIRRHVKNATHWTEERFGDVHAALSRHHAALHEKLDEQHKERMDQARQFHEEHMTRTQAHHEARMKDAASKHKAQLAAIRASKKETK